MGLSIIHLYLYGMLKREVREGNIIHIQKIHPIVRWIIRIPRQYHHKIVKEMVELGLLKKLNRDLFELISPSRTPPYDSLGEPLW